MIFCGSAIYIFNGGNLNNMRDTHYYTIFFINKSFLLDILKIA